MCIADIFTNMNPFLILYLVLIVALLIAIAIVAIDDYNGNGYTIDNEEDYIAIITIIMFIAMS